VLAMTRERFGEIMEEAVAELPAAIEERLRDVLLVVEDEPSDDDLEMLGFDRGDVVFGMFDGTPLSERSTADTYPSPDRIVLFYRPLVREFRTPWAIRRQIRVTLIHEVAHFLGMDEDEVAAEGYG
jgi:predicted Zn-dependent protease with MMP-like domain